MTSVKDVTSERFNTLSDDMTEALMGLVSNFARQHGLSGLSATTLALQMIAGGLREIGGPSSRAYLQAVVDINFCRDERTAHKINGRSRNAMEKMAEHFDAQHRAFNARTLQ